MLVSRFMDQHPQTVEPDATVTVAQLVMHETKAFHLPVVDGKKRLLGLVTRQTLLIEPEALGSTNVWDLTRYLSGLTVREVMIRNRNLLCIDPQSTFEQAAARMVNAKVGCLPVVDGDRLAGLITSERLLALLTEMLAVDIPAVRATMKMPMKKGELAKLVSAVSAQGWGILTLGCVPDEKDRDMCLSVLKIRYVNLEDVKAVLSSVPGQQLLDIRMSSPP